MCDRSLSFRYRITSLGGYATISAYAASPPFFVVIVVVIFALFIVVVFFPFPTQHKVHQRNRIVRILPPHRQQRIHRRCHQCCGTISYEDRLSASLHCGGGTTPPTTPTTLRLLLLSRLHHHIPISLISEQDQKRP